MPPKKAGGKQPARKRAESIPPSKPMGRSLNEDAVSEGVRDAFTEARDEHDEIPVTPEQVEALRNHLAASGAQTRLDGSRIESKGVHYEKKESLRHKFETQHFRASLTQDKVDQFLGADDRTRRLLVQKAMRLDPDLTTEPPAGAWTRERDEIVEAIVFGEVTE